jgi:hypothetical protein
VSPVDQLAYPCTNARRCLGKVHQGGAGARWISWVLRYLLPRLLIPRSLVLPPVGCCRGVNPSQAARSRPLAKAGAVADRGQECGCVIEQALAKLKQLVRSAAPGHARHCAHSRRALGCFTATECQNFLANSGYIRSA